MSHDQNYIKSDGNGGFEANVQKAMLKKWGPIAGAGILVVSGLAAQVGETLWSALIGHSGDLQRIEALEVRVDQNRNDDVRFRNHLEDELREVRVEIREVKSILLGKGE